MREEDAEIEERITYEIVVDCYDEYERAVGWHCALEEQISFPFEAKCINKVSTSPLKPEATVKVVAMADQLDCAHDMYVSIAWDGDILDVPLSQIEPIKTDAETQQIIGDWHYWSERGYGF